MDSFHKDFENYLESFKATAEQTAQLMDAMRRMLNRYFTYGELNVSVKDLYEMVSDLKYAAEKRYNIDNGIEGDDDFYLSSKRLKDQMVEALKEFCSEQEITVVKKEEDDS